MARTAAPGLRDRILDAAAELLREGGARGLTQPRTARRAGIPQGHLTYYFPRKSDLLAAVAARFRDDVARDLARLGAARVAGQGRAAMGRLLTRLVRDVGRTRSLLGLLVASQEDRALRRTLLEIIEEGRPALAAAIGLSPRDPAIEVAQAIVWGLELQQLLYARSPRAVARLVDTLLGSIGGDP
jgi:AcrR family transcriptional regulator